GVVFMVGLSMIDEIGTTRAMYYLRHDMIIKAALFMLVGFIIYRTGKADSEHLGGLIKRHPVAGWMFLVAGFALAGVPPLSGFYGKFFIVQSTFDNDHYIAGLIVLISSLAVLLSVVRIFINFFWRWYMV